MIASILDERLVSCYQRIKLVSLENYYVLLKPYMKVMKSSQMKKSDINMILDRSKTDYDQSTFIEENQIIYAKLMTERMLKG